MSSAQKHTIDFDHHAPELRDYNDQVLDRLRGTGCPLGWSESHGGFWAIWGYDALYDAVQASGQAQLSFRASRRLGRSVWTLKRRYA